MSIILSFGWRGFGYDGPPIRELRLGCVSIAMSRRIILVEVAAMRIALLNSRNALVSVQRHLPHDVDQAV